MILQYPFKENRLLLCMSTNTIKPNMPLHGSSKQASSGSKFDLYDPIDWNVFAKLQSPVKEHGSVSMMYTSAMSSTSSADCTYNGGCGANSQAVSISNPVALSDTRQISQLTLHGSVTPLR